MRRWFAAYCLIVGVLVAPVSASAACRIVKYVDIPVTMAGRRPIVTAQINGRDARLILDSGAFFSTIARATAQEYGLPITEMGNARLKGIGGDTSLGVTTAKELRIAGIPIPHIQFAVGGSDTGYAGLLGQNILGRADVEYDLPHGTVRLMKNDGCRNGNLAYWAGTKPSTRVQIEPAETSQYHTISTITINGVKIKAGFDTGADGSMLTLAAAKRLGVTPDTPGVTPDEFVRGVGQKRVRAWRARFDKIDIGGEAISKPWLTIAEQLLDGADMLIGIDFFLTHRIYIDNQNHWMFITYEGGPLFGLNPNRAVDDRGAALDLADKAGEPTDAAGYSRRGAILASSGKLDQAIADFNKAVAMAPSEAHYLVQRGMAHLSNRQPLLGATDLDEAIALAPGDSDARLTRAELRLAAHDPAGALTDLQAADQTLAPSSHARLRLAGMYDAADDPARALPNFDQWLKSHPEDSSRAVALNGRCWSRALLNQDLGKAASDCDAAIKLRPGEANALDSRALVRLRQGAFDKALADYDAALALQPRNAWSRYARSIVERRTGKIAAADTDKAAATAINPRVVERAKRYGIDAPTP